MEDIGWRNSIVAVIRHGVNVDVYAEECQFSLITTRSIYVYFPRDHHLYWSQLSIV